MKSLKESLFDDDLVSKQFSLYDFITEADEIAYRYIPYLNSSKIKKDFNELMKNYKTQDWHNNSYLSMKKIRSMDMDELLRELVYIIAIKLTELKEYYMERYIYDILMDYVFQNKSEHIRVIVKNNIIRITFFVRSQPSTDYEPAGEINIRYKY